MFPLLHYTPEMVCWRFAAGCLAAREHELDPRRYRTLYMHLMHGTYPSDRLVRDAFPKPFARLLEQGCSITTATMWEYWLHHAEGEHTPVRRTRVHTVLAPHGGPHFVQVANTEHGRRVYRTYHNFLRIAVEPGNEILVHGAVLSALA